MIGCFPPSLFSPASRHESLPTFFTYRKREGKRKALKGNRMKYWHPMQAVQTTSVCGVLSVVSNWNSSIPSGDPKWKPTVARQSSEVWKRCDGGAVGFVILPSQSVVGWDRARRLLDKCFSNTRRSSCTAAVHEGPRVWRYLRRSSVQTARGRRAVHLICILVFLILRLEVKNAVYIFFLIKTMPSVYMSKLHTILFQIFLLLSTLMILGELIVCR